jgi:VCBS repeat-containing protein
MRILFSDNFDRPASSSLGTPLIGGPWIQYNQFPDGTTIGAQFFGPAITEISGNELGFQFSTPSPDAFPAVSAALSQPVGSYPVTVSFDFTPDADGRENYVVGLTSSQSLSGSGPNGVVTPQDGIGIQFGRSSTFFANSEISLVYFSGGQSVQLIQENLPNFQFTPGVAYHFKLTINGDGSLSASVSDGANTTTLNATGAPTDLSLIQLFMTDIDGGLSNAGVGTQVQLFDNIAVTEEGNQPPSIDVTQSVVDGTISELPNVTSNPAVDSTSGFIAFSDPDLNDRPTASVDIAHETLVYQDSSGAMFTLSPAQTAALESGFLIVPEVGNTNTGKIDWGYTIPDSTLDFLGAGEHVTLTVPLVFDDHNGGTVTQDVVVTINGADDAPTAVPDSASIQKGGTATGNVLANDSDPDIHDTLHVTQVNGLSANVGQPIKGQDGTLTLGADGSYTYQASQNAKPGSHDQFSYTIDDGHGGTASSLINLAISAAGTPTPYGAVVAIWVHFQNDPPGTVRAGTGIFIGPNEILTAAHLFDAPGAGPVTEVKVLTGLEASTGGASFEFDTKNVRGSLGSTSFASHGAGLTSAVVQGYDPYASGQLDPTHDLAVLGISEGLGDTLGTLAIEPNAKDGTYTLVGFPGPVTNEPGSGGILVVDTERASLDNIPAKVLYPGAWTGSFNALDGMSGGPLLSANNHIVGIQSLESQLLGTAVEDRIDNSQLQDIHKWMQADISLLAAPAIPVQTVASLGASSQGSSLLAPSLVHGGGT